MHCSAIYKPQSRVYDVAASRLQITWQVEWACKINETMIGAVYDKTAPGKIGHYVTGTRIPIVSDNEFDPTKENGPLVNTAWRVADKINAYRCDLGYVGELTDPISPDDVR